MDSKEQEEKKCHHPQLPEGATISRVDQIRYSGIGGFKYLYRGHCGTLPQTVEQWEVGEVIPVVYPTAFWGVLLNNLTTLRISVLK